MTTIESPLVPALVAPGMFLVQAGLAGGRDHALACLLALNGLRIIELPASITSIKGRC